MSGPYRCLRLLQRYTSRYGEGGVFPSHAHIARELRVAVRSVERWMAELKRVGAVQATRRGPRSSSYRVLWRDVADVMSFERLTLEFGGSLENSPNSVERPVENCGNEGAFGGSFGGSFGPASITKLPSEDLTAPSELAECEPQPASQPAEEDAEPGSLVETLWRDTRCEIRGQMADRDTVERLAAELGSLEAYEAFRARLREWSRRNTPQSWGILVHLARDVRAQLDGVPLRKPMGKAGSRRARAAAGGWP